MSDSKRGTMWRRGMAVLRAALIVPLLACVMPPQQQGATAPAPAEEEVGEYGEEYGEEYGGEGYGGAQSYPDEESYGGDETYGGGGGGAAGGSSCGQTRCSTDADCTGCGPCNSFSKTCLLF